MKNFRKSFLSVQFCTLNIWLCKAAWKCNLYCSFMVLLIKDVLRTWVSSTIINFKTSNCFRHAHKGDFLKFSHICTYVPSPFVNQVSKDSDYKYECNNSSNRWNNDWLLIAHTFYETKFLYTLLYKIQIWNVASPWWGLIPLWIWCHLDKISCSYRWVTLFLIQSICTHPTFLGRTTHYCVSWYVQIKTTLIKCTFFSTLLIEHS